MPPSSGTAALPWPTNSSVQSECISTRAQSASGQLLQESDRAAPAVPAVPPLAGRRKAACARCPAPWLRRAESTARERYARIAGKVVSAGTETESSRPECLQAVQALQQISLPAVAPA